MHVLSAGAICACAGAVLVLPAGAACWCCACMHVLSLPTVNPQQRFTLMLLAKLMLHHKDNSNKHK